MSESGLIFDIKKYAINDGPGIRITLFFKGCPLSCIWCHNPEGISFNPDNVIISRMIGEKKICHEEMVGSYYSVEDVLAIVEKEKVFINQSNGGVTFSGGEPLFQPEFLLAALKGCKAKGYHTAVDTSGFSSSSDLRSIIPYTDLFLFDIKHLNDLKHVEFTGVSNKLILENYRLLMNSGNEIMIRIPIIPGFNDDRDSLEKMKQFILETKTKSLSRISLLFYHKTGSSKYIKFNIPDRMENKVTHSMQMIKEIKYFFSDIGVRVKVGG